MPDYGSGRSSRTYIVAVVLTVALLITFIAALAVGSVSIAPGRVVNALIRPDHADQSALAVVRQVRIPRSVAAALTGAALAVAGTQMQTVFRNPLADPFVLGVTSGASLGVALVVLAAGTGSSAWLGGLSLAGHLSIASAAFLGATGATMIALAVARRVQGTAAVLIVGVMLSALISAVVSLIVAGASPVRLQQFVAWGFGSFRGVTMVELRVLVPVVLAGLLAAFAMAKPLNALLLGERYAASMGVNVRRTTTMAMIISSALAGTVTAFAGPIGFVGIAAPHLARPLIGTSDHRVLMPTAAAVGAIIALCAEMVAQLPGREGVLPLNAVTSLIGAPVVVWVLVRRGRTQVVT